MLRTTFYWAFVLATSTLSATRASAATIAEYTGGTLSLGTVFGGQAITTPSGGPWDDISFNFYSDVPATTPSAAGTLFLLSNSYTGLPSGLSTSTSGFIAASVNIVGGVYVFDPGVTLQPNTEYFLYPNAQVPESGVSTGGTPGSFATYARNASTNYVNITGATENFRLSGAVASVPEPGTTYMPLAAAGLLFCMYRFPKARKPSDEV